jgi:GTPase involved in cell partitioning and DNA repair
LTNYDKKLEKKKEIIFFNKSDLLGNKETIKKLSEFKKKIKLKYEVISVFSNKDLLKVKKILIKNVN